MIKNIKPVEAWELLKSDANSQLIDVRTKEEWQLTGMVNLQSIGKQAFLRSWKLWPEMDMNHNFVPDIKKLFADQQTKLLFICRSGARSLQAADAMSAEGYSDCYNVSDGFEGNVNDERQRNSISGWKFSNLPWFQD